MNSKQTLLSRLDATIEDAVAKARLNYRLAYICYIVAFLGGAASSVILTLERTKDYHYFAVIAGFLPTLALSALTTFKLSARSDWHYDRVRELRKIWRHLVNAQDDQITPLVDSWNKVEDELDRRWPKFGVLPHAEPDQCPKTDK